MEKSARLDLRVKNIPLWPGRPSADVPDSGTHARQKDTNYNISESGHDSRVSYLTGKPLADKAHISTSKTYSQQRDYRFDMKTFTELKNAQSVTLAYDGLDPLPPMFCYLKPYFNDINKSYFRQLADGQL